MNAKLAILLAGVRYLLLTGPVPAEAPARVEWHEDQQMAVICRGQKCVRIKYAPAPVMAAGLTDRGEALGPLPTALAGTR
jgi:hypothetical protein